MSFGSDTFQLRIVANVASQYVENVLNFQNLTAGSDNKFVDAAQLVSLFITNIQPSWLACLSQDYLLAGYYCKCIGPTKTASTQQPVVDTPGLIASDVSTSGQGAMIVSSGQNAANKFVTAKIFLPGAPANLVVQNQPTGEYLGLLNTLITKLKGVYGTAPYNFQYCIVDRKAPTEFPPQLWQVSKTIGTIRARQKSGGRGHRRP